MLDSLNRRARGRRIGEALAALSDGRVGGRPRLAAELEARTAELERRSAELAERAVANASVEEQLRVREERAALALAWDPTVHEIPEREVTAGPAARALLARLDADDHAAIEAAVADDATRARVETQLEPTRSYARLEIGTQIASVREKTGLLPDVPPEDVHAMDRTPGGALDIADLVLGTLERAGVELPEGGSALDFGSSSGRVVRPLAAARPDVRWHGCDPNADAVEWGRRNLPGIDFSVSPQEPPLAFDDASFDLAYGISIWSHFDAPAGLTWLAEMHRVLRPGGVLLLTAAGLHNVATLPQWGVDGQYVRACAAALNQRGFWFVDAFGEDGDWGVKHSAWGQAFMTPEWLLARVTPAWALRLYEPGALQGVQDVYLLERR